ncbi:MAG: Hsp20/alpha crystallin family protein [Polyangiaceae bacterium]
MFGDFRDFDRTFAAFDQLRSRLDRAFDDVAFETRGRASVGDVPINVYDRGEHFLVLAEIPGAKEGDVDVTVHQNVLTLRAKRSTKVPEGYSVHRRERPTFEFARSLTLPTKIDAEAVTARLEDGILRLELTKAKDARPRQIAVRAS